MTFRATAALLCLLAILAFRPVEGAPLVGRALPHSGLPETVRYYGPDSQEQTPLYGRPVVCEDVERQMVVLNPEIVVGEPLHLRLLLRAHRPELEPQFVGQLAWGTGIRALLIPPNSQRSYEYLGQRLGSNVPMGSVTFDRFTTMRLDFRMAMDRETVTGAAFDVPGTYQMRILHKCHGSEGWEEEVQLGDFRITVREAEEDDARALEILDDYSIFEFFQMRSTFRGDRRVASEEQVGMLRRLVEEAPDAALRPHAMIILAEHHRRSHEPEQAKELYGRVMEEYSGSPVAEEAAMARLRVSMAFSEPAEAARDFARVWADSSLTQLVYPGSPHWQMFVQEHLPERSGTQWMVFDGPGPDPEMAREDGGPRVVFSEEVQEMWGLPEEYEGESLELPIQ